MRGHARHGKAVARVGAELQVAPLAPVGIGHDGLPPDLVKSDVLRGVPCSRGDGNGRVDPMGVTGRPLQHLHATHRSADDTEELIDAEMIDQRHLRVHHVADGDDREIEAPGLAGHGVDAGRARRAHAAAEHVGADDEEAVGVDGLARARPWSPTSRVCLVTGCWLATY